MMRESGEIAENIWSITVMEGLKVQNYIVFFKKKCYKNVLRIIGIKKFKNIYLFGMILCCKSVLIKFVDVHILYNIRHLRA